MHLDFIFGITDKFNDSIEQGYFDVHCSNPISLFALFFTKFIAKSISSKVLAPVEIKIGFFVLAKNSIYLK